MKKQKRKIPAQKRRLDENFCELVFAVARRMGKPMKIVAINPPASPIAIPFFQFG